MKHYPEMTHRTIATVNTEKKPTLFKKNLCVTLMMGNNSNNDSNNNGYNTPKLAWENFCFFSHMFLCAFEPWLT